jgi:hypothetical protein
VTLCQYFRILFLRSFPVRMSYEHSSNSQQLQSHEIRVQKMEYGPQFNVNENTACAIRHHHHHHEVWSHKKYVKTFPPLLIAKSLPPLPPLLGKVMQLDEVFFCKLTVKLKACACEPIVNFHTWILVSVVERFLHLGRQFLGLRLSEGTCVPSDLMMLA